MIREVLTDGAMISAPMVALVLFTVLFLGGIIWLFRPGQAGRMEPYKNIPLLDEEGRSGQETESGKN